MMKIPDEYRLFGAMLFFVLLCAFTAPIKADEQAEKPDLRVFTLVNAQSESMGALVDSLFSDSHQQLRIAVDSRTNSVVVSGDAETVEMIGALLMKLDQPVDEPSDGLGSSDQPRKVAVAERSGKTKSVIQKHQSGATRQQIEMQVRLAEQKTALMSRKMESVQAHAELERWKAEMELANAQTKLKIVLQRAELLAGSVKQGLANNATSSEAHAEAEIMQRTVELMKKQMAVRKAKPLEIDELEFELLKTHLELRRLKMLLASTPSSPAK